MLLFIIIYLPIIVFANNSCYYLRDWQVSRIGENGPIDISVSTSRISGVAPLSVFFDATGTEGLGYTNEGFFSGGANYMDATFAWDFDADNNDPSGNYEKASGFVAAHIFEQPGTYRVHLDVYDSTGETASEDITITVSAFIGTTYYVASAANGGSDSNPGTIAEPFLTPEHALTGPHMQPNTMILFRRGDTFYTPHFWVWDYNGPVIIDCYGNPADDKPLIYSTEANGAYATFSLYTDDWRVMNLAVQSGGSTYNSGTRYPTGINFGINSSHNLKYRTEEYSLGNLPMSPSGNYNTIAECEFYNVNGTGYTTTSDGDVNDGNAIIGNWVYDKTGDDEEHVFRLQGGSRYFIANNTFGPNILVNYDATTIRGNSEKVVIYKNRMEGWIQAIWPQNRDSASEYQHHCIMDSNLIIGQGLYDGDRQSAIAIRAKDIVIRNNIIYNYQYGVMISDDTVVGPSQRIKVYNNTFINPAANDTFKIVNVDEACYNIDIKNNLMLDIAGGNPLNTSFLEVTRGSIFNGESDYNMFYGSSWGVNPNLFSGSTLAVWLSSTGNDRNSSIADPQLLSTDYSNTNFCKPQAGSPVINAGGFTPNALDYNGNLRDSSCDIGACEYY